MLGIKELRENKDIIHDIDWDMTPEEAVTLYLEWGNNWSHGKNLVRSKADLSRYFVLNAWERPPNVVLVERNSEEAKELAFIPLPEEISRQFLEEINHNYGVYAVTGNVKQWLMSVLYDEQDPI